MHKYLMTHSGPGPPVVVPQQVTVHREMCNPLESRWGRFGGGDESPPPSSPGAEPLQAR